MEKKKKREIDNVYFIFIKEFEYVYIYFRQRGGILNYYTYSAAIKIIRTVVLYTQTLVTTQEHVVI